MLLARSDQAAPGGGGATFGRFILRSFGDDGSVYVVAVPETPAMVPYVMTPDGVFHRIVAAGDRVQVAPGDVRTVGLVIPGHGLSQMREVAVGLEFTDGSSGVFNAAPGSSCYANCDGSTAAPTLNVNDFVCFTQRFASNDPYANCDGSTSLPTLNVNDFVCFQQRFAAGCR